jgi:hypothetical protein
VDLRAGNTVFENIAAIYPTEFNLTGLDRADRILGMRASADLFPTLGVKPLRGRTFLADEDRPNAGRVAVISYRLWRSRLGSGAVSIMLVGVTVVACYSPRSTGGGFRSYGRYA